MKFDDDLIFKVISLLQEAIPNELVDCRDIDYSKLAESFSHGLLVNQRFSINKENLTFEFGDGQYVYVAKVQIADTKEPILAVCQST